VTPVFENLNRPWTYGQKVRGNPESQRTNCCYCYEHLWNFMQQIKVSVLFYKKSKQLKSCVFSDNISKSDQCHSGAPFSASAQKPL